MKKTVTILGSTGSIGTQTLKVCRAQNYRVEALTAHSNVELLEEQIREFRPKTVVLSQSSGYQDLKTRVADLSVEIRWGKDQVEEIAAQPVDIVVNAISGIAGLRPTLAALGAGSQLALANKEALVVGGELVMTAAKTSGAEILPVDSEHSAIWQCLQSGKLEEVESIILTASGGPFLGKKREELQQISVREALAHPTWTMGKKISIDSATLMNKGLEVLEAMWLFQQQPENIQVVVHPQSIVHSAVAFRDGAVIAQMGTPDMRVAIQYAMTYPHREYLDVKPLSLPQIQSLTFEEPDVETFTGLSSCFQAAKQGGFAPCVVNGANEQAVSLFLSGKIGFLQIGELVQSALDQVTSRKAITLERLEEMDQQAREHVRQQVAESGSL